MDRFVQRESIDINSEDLTWNCIHQGISLRRVEMTIQSQSSNSLLNYVPILLLLSLLPVLQANPTTENGIKTEVFLSPTVVLEPGSVSNKYYYDIDFPRGHIAIKSFNGEVVDEKGNPVPLHETYLHHWVVLRYYQKTGEHMHVHHGDLAFHHPNYVAVKNSGICDYGLSQYFGLGSETRRTATYVPDPYAIEVGNPADIPAGYEERWMLNLHAIDTRGAEDKLGCTECKCDLYNVTVGEYGEVLPSSYIGGLRCCHDQARCRVKDSFQGVKRTLYVRYTVKYVDWNPSIVPVKIFILDVTDIWTKADQSRGLREKHTCLIEYQVESCPVGASNDDCTHMKTVSVSFPTGGEVIYGVGHQHTGGIGTTLYGEGGRLICSSIPTYGEGAEPGNEEGYIVGMSTCYPLPGSVKISEGEMLTLVSNYSSARRHTGVMGLFYLLIAEPSKKADNLLHAPVEVKESITMHNTALLFTLFGVAVTGAVVFVLKGRKLRGEGYEALP